MTELEGSEVGRLQVEIPTEKIKEEITAEPLEVTETEFEITAEGEGFCYVLSKQTGFFESIVKGGEELLTKPMKLSYFRATTDNDRNVKALWDRTNIWQGENFDCVFNKVYSAKIPVSYTHLDVYKRQGKLKFLKYRSPLV